MCLFGVCTEYDIIKTPLFRRVTRTWRWMVEGACSSKERAKSAGVCDDLLLFCDTRKRTHMYERSEARSTTTSSSNSRTILSLTKQQPKLVDQTSFVVDKGPIDIGTTLI
jgi:hypothetical protein